MPDDGCCLTVSSPSAPIDPMKPVVGFDSEHQSSHDVRSRSRSSLYDQLAMSRHVCQVIPATICPTVSSQFLYSRWAYVGAGQPMSHARPNRTYRSTGSLLPIDSKQPPMPTRSIGPSIGSVVHSHPHCYTSTSPVLALQLSDCQLGTAPVHPLCPKDRRCSQPEPDIQLPAWEQLGRREGSNQPIPASNQPVVYKTR